jgi:hypothetical protein
MQITSMRETMSASQQELAYAKSALESARQSERATQEVLDAQMRGWAADMREMLAQVMYSCEIYLLLHSVEYTVPYIKKQILLN